MRSGRLRTTPHGRTRVARPSRRSLIAGTLLVALGVLVGYLTSPTLVGGNRAVDSNVSPSGTTPSALPGGSSDLTLDFGYYLTGSILTETIFSWPGLGRYVVNAITRRDLPAIQGSVLFLSVVFVLVNLLTDLAYAKADPRVAYS